MMKSRTIARGLGLALLLAQSAAADPARVVKGMRAGRGVLSV